MVSRSAVWSLLSFTGMGFMFGVMPTTGVLTVAALGTDVFDDAKADTEKELHAAATALILEVVGYDDDDDDVQFALLLFEAWCVEG